MIRPSAALVICGFVLSAAALAGCADKAPPPSQPTFYQDLAQTDATVDAAAAASMISGYRSNNGLGAVTVDPELMRFASEQARNMAAHDKMDHDIARPFADRIRNRSSAAASRSRTFPPATTRWRKRFPAGAICRRTAPTCSIPASRAWASPRSMRRLEVQGVLGADPRRPRRAAGVAQEFVMAGRSDGAAHLDRTNRRGFYRRAAIASGSIAYEVPHRRRSARVAPSIAVARSGGVRQHLASARHDLSLEPRQAYAGSRIERAAFYRGDDAALAAMTADDRVRYYVIVGELAVLKKRGEAFDPLFSPTEAAALGARATPCFSG